MSDPIKQMAIDAKITPAAIAITTGSGLGTWFDFIPSDIGKLGCLVGITLSIFLIRVNCHQASKLKREIKEIDARIALINQKKD